MKKLWLLIVVAIIVSCEPEKKVDYAIVSGKIANAKKITVYSALNRSEKIEITLSDDGSFKDTLRMTSDHYVLRQNNNLTTIFAPKGSEVIVNYDAKKKDSTLQFNGDKKAINKYIVDKEAVSETARGDFKEMYLKNEKDFKEHITKIKTTQENLFSKVDQVSETYKNNELKNINYEYLSSLSNYKSYHSYYAKDKDFKPSEGYLSELKNLNLENENDYIFSSNYRSVVKSKLRSASQELVEKDSIANDIAYLTAISAIKNDKIRNDLLFADAKYGITYTEDLEAYYAIYSKHSTNEANNNKIKADYNKLKSLAKGSPSPKFVDYENNAGGKTSLDDLKGKYLYLDIWATWCGPCIGEIPSLKKVEKQFHDKNIEFVSISIDRIKDHEKWKKMIVDKELGGLQLFADSDWKSQFITDYMIKGIPRFILIDPQGNIISANAPRPSDEKLVKTLKSLNL